MLLQNFLHSPSKPFQTSLRHALHCLPNESASSVPAHPTLTPAHNCRRCLLQSGHVPGHSVMFASTRWHRVPAQYRRLGLGGHSLFQENPKSSMLDMLITIPVLSREPAPVTPGATGSPGTGCSITGSITDHTGYTQSLPKYVHLEFICPKVRTTNASRSLELVALKRVPSDSAFLTADWILKSVQGFTFCLKMFEVLSCY